LDIYIPALVLESSLSLELFNLEGHLEKSVLKTTNTGLDEKSQRKRQEKRKKIYINGDVTVTSFSCNQKKRTKQGTSSTNIAGAYFLSWYPCHSIHNDQFS
jgi:hypothetical protein